MKKDFLISFAVLAVFVAFSRTDWDMRIQDCFYDGGWLVSPEIHRKLSIFFYRGFKVFAAVSGMSCLFCFAGSFFQKRLEPYRGAFLMMTLSLIFVPAVVAGAKQFTNQYCPKQITRYGGVFEHRRLFDPLPQSGAGRMKKGKCFPAGHATSGFAFMALYFCFKSRRKRQAGLAFGLCAGWIAGTYQMLRGEHFLSHTLVGMTASWIVILTLYALVKRLYTDPASSKRVDNS